MDLINRQDAIDALKGLPTWWADSGGYYGGAQPPMEALLDPEDAVSAIENLPSAERVGHWVKYPKFGVYECSLCGERFRFTFHQHNYCPNCGSRNEVNK